MDRSDTKPACFRWSRAVLVGAGALVFSASGAGLAGEIGGKSLWNASPKAVTFCFDLSPSELEEAIRGGECLDVVKQVESSVAPAAAPAAASSVASAADPAASSSESLGAEPTAGESVDSSAPEGGTQTFAGRRLDAGLRIS